MGEGGGAAIHCLSAAIQDAVWRAGGAVVTDSHNPPERVWRLISQPQESKGLVEVVEP
jgi:2-furoyl-CoA dehydrogenase large subunit